MRPHENPAVKHERETAPPPPAVSGRQVYRLLPPDGFKRRKSRI